MKAVLNQDLTFRELVDDRVVTDPLLTREWVPSEKPVAKPGHKVVDGAHSITATQVIQAWIEVPMTDAEAQTMLSEPIIRLLTNAERVSLEDACNSGANRGKAISVRSFFQDANAGSREPGTKAAFKAAIELGVIADVARARAILGDSGVSIA